MICRCVSKQQTKPRSLLIAGAWVVLVCVAGCQRTHRVNENHPDVDASAAALAQIGIVSHPADARRLVGQLNAVDRHRLRQNKSRFDALDEDEKDRLRDFHRKVCASDSGTELYTVLRRYREWLATVPDGQRADLLELSPEERIAKIRTVRQSQQVSSFRVHVGDIPPEDAITVARWLRDYVQNHASQLLLQLPDHVKSQIGRMPDGRRRQRMLFMEVARNINSIQLPNPERSHLQQLRDSLSTDGAVRLGQLVDLDDSALAVRHLLTRRAESMQRQMPSRERLVDFYNNDLTTEQRDRIDQLVPDEAHRELRRQFFLRQMRGRGAGEAGRRPFRAGEGPPDRPPGRHERRERGKRGPPRERP